MELGFCLLDRRLTQRLRSFTGRHIFLFVGAHATLDVSLTHLYNWPVCDNNLCDCTFAVSFFANFQTNYGINDVMIN